jgi:hypothetical protein
LVSPIINFAFNGCTNSGRNPACSISSTIQYQFPVASTATAVPAAHPLK